MRHYFTFKTINELNVFFMVSDHINMALNCKLTVESSSLRKCVSPERTWADKKPINKHIDGQKVDDNLTEKQF